MIASLDYNKQYHNSFCNEKFSPKPIFLIIYNRQKPRESDFWWLYYV